MTIDERAWVLCEREGEHFPPSEFATWEEALVHVTGETTGHLKVGGRKVTFARVSGAPDRQIEGLRPDPILVDPPLTVRRHPQPRAGDAGRMDVDGRD